MSQAPQPIVIVKESNEGGVVGFIVSLVGFLTCGLLSPIGLLISLVALLKPPRTFALAGVIFGLLGSFWFFVWGFAIITSVMSVERSREVETPVITQEQMDEQQKIIDAQLERQKERRKQFESLVKPKADR